LNISDTACRSASNGKWAALWLGPDEQFVLAPVADGEAVAGQLRAALSALPHSLVDVSHRQIAIEISGPTAHTLLSAGCPLDLHLGSFPPGMCTRTILGKADIVLWRTGADSFHVEVWRSFADYVTRFLAAASRELA
jgi:sarcosine oxidase subunit gamma